MRRIGMAASKIAQGNIWFYNLAVLVISCLFALFVFFVCGFIIGVAVFGVSLVAQYLLHMDHEKDWLGVLKICLSLLGILVSIGTLVAIIKNVKFKT